MRKTVLFTLLFIVACCLHAQPSYTKKEAFPLPDILKNMESVPVKNIAVEEILDPKHIEQVGKYTIVGSSQSEDIFSIYTTPGFKHYISFGKKGEGPDDFLSADAFNIGVYDTTTFYTLKRNMKAPTYRLFQIKDGKVSHRENIPYTNDKNIVGSPVEGIEIWTKRTADSFTIYSCSTKDRETVIDTARSMRLGYNAREDGSRYVHNMPTVYHGDGMIVLSYYQLARIDLYNVDSKGKIEHVGGFGDTNLTDTREDVINIPGKMVPYKDGIYRMVGGKTTMAPSRERYTDVFIGSKYIYGVYSCRENPMTMSGGSKAYIHVFNRKGTPVKSFLLNADIKFPTHLAIEPESGTAYGHNPWIDFDYVKTFDIGSRLP